jgi:hypothetical protein
MQASSRRGADDRTSVAPRAAVGVLTACLALLGCDGTALLAIDVRTNLRAEVDFESVRTTVVADAPLEPIGKAAVRSEPWVDGVRVAETRVRRGPARVTVELLDADGQVVARRLAQLTVDGATVRTLILTRECLDVTCPSGRTCDAGGRCVSPECTEETPEACGPTACVSAEDCGTGTEAECVTVECTDSGACFVAANDAACGPSERCDPLGGCMAPGSCDGSPCRLLPQCGCGVGQACRVSSSFTPECGPTGTARQTEPCVGLADCAPGFQCVGPSEAPMGSCATYCDADADCPPGSFCVGTISPDVGFCHAPCDPLTLDGCGAGLECKLTRSVRFEDGRAALHPGCQAAGGAAIGEPCGADRRCQGAALCTVSDDICRELCLVDAPSCTAGSCSALSPEHVDPSSGSPIGVCR